MAGAKAGGGGGAARLAALLYALYPAHIAGTGDTAAEPTATLVMMAGIALVVKARGVSVGRFSAGWC
ncbi:hypothetical protein P0F65_06245 [Sphingomonas sp. I4]